MFGKYNKVGTRVYGGGGGIDPDAQAFITAAGITDATQQQAINTLVVDMKGYGIWTKMKAIYPFVGGTATAHKYNLKDPRDLDAAFRLVFNGGWTHSSNGATPNGTNGYADTFLNNSTVLGQNDNSFSIYSRTDLAQADACDMGVFSGGFGSSIYGRNVDNNSYSSHSGVLLIKSASTSLGFIGLSRNAINNCVFDSLGTQLISTTNSVNHVNVEWNIGRLAGFAGEYSSRQLAFVHIGLGLSATELSNLRIAVNTFETTLSRNV
jgi:hypothetical protein